MLRIFNRASPVEWMLRIFNRASGAGRARVKNGFRSLQLEAICFRLSAF
jgi:hypothetical protein